MHADSFGGTPSAGGAEEAESELLCFQCYRPMAHPPAAGDLRLLDAQRGRHKCFHARCLAAMDAEKRARITQSADPWGGSCDKCPTPIGIAAFASPAAGLLRCKTCPAVFCAEHVPPYVCHLHGGIACGVCTQRLQAMGRQFQAGGGAWYAQTCVCEELHPQPSDHICVLLWLQVVAAAAVDSGAGGGGRGCRDHRRAAVIVAVQAPTASTEAATAERPARYAHRSFGQRALFSSPHP